MKAGSFPRRQSTCTCSRDSRSSTVSFSSLTRSRRALGVLGKLFASEHYDLSTNIIITAKSLAGGLPLAAVTGRTDVMEASEVGGLGGTYGGNPLACAAAIAVIDAMDAERIPEKAERVGARIAARFREWAARYPCIGDVRGLGAMIAMELVSDRESRTPDKALTGRLLAAALERGLILLSSGTYGNTVRVLAPLTAADAVVDEGLAVLGLALEAVARGSVIERCLWAEQTPCPPGARSRSLSAAMWRSSAEAIPDSPPPRALARIGASVTVLERHSIGWGASGRNGGMVLSGYKPRPPSSAGSSGSTRPGASFDSHSRQSHVSRR